MDELEFLRGRDEILQALYWMRGEGLGDSVGRDELARFLAVDVAPLDAQLARLVERGDLALAGGRYRLTAAGERHGRDSFADEFADLTRPAHGECDADCWCHDSPEEAARCLEERAGHRHPA